MARGKVLDALLKPASRPRRVLARAARGTWMDGYFHAGNLAYMALLAIFPFFILGTAALSLVGEARDQAASLTSLLTGLPPAVRSVIEPVVEHIIAMRSGWLMWAGGLFGLWTVSSLIETIRDILRRAHGTGLERAFWHNRLISTGLILASVVVMMISLFAQVAIGAAQEVIQAWFPQLVELMERLSLSRLVPALGLYFSIHMLLVALTPQAYRTRRFAKWPGALLVTAWIIAVTMVLPRLLRVMVTYDVTYGSLAGIMITLFFFWLVGLGMVAGAELNAALALTQGEDGDQ